MPIYEYVCNECRHLFTVEMTFSEYGKKKNHKCPKCKSENLKRIYTGFSAVTSKKSWLFYMWRCSKFVGIFSAFLSFSNGINFIPLYYNLELPLIQAGYFLGFICTIFHCAAKFPFNHKLIFWKTIF